MRKFDFINLLIDIAAVLLVTVIWAGMYFSEDAASIARSAGTISACAFLVCLRLVYLHKRK